MATIALNKCGIDKYIVHEALNHTDESMRVTDIYIERDFVNENKANAKVIKYVFLQIIANTSCLLLCRWEFFYTFTKNFVIR